jgi:hypothetical protein
MVDKNLAELRAGAKEGDEGGQQHGQVRLLVRNMFDKTPSTTERGRPVGKIKEGKWTKCSNCTTFNWRCEYCKNCLDPNTDLKRKRKCLKREGCPDPRISKRYANNRNESAKSKNSNSENTSNKQHKSDPGGEPQTPTSSKEVGTG